ncbi:MAG: hypothetical protein JSS82_01125 [Bacteroidetes bacterium]|nr:hypothetical protein [Bacteroidota bacterium]
MKNVIIIALLLIIHFTIAFRIIKAVNNAPNLSEKQKRLRRVLVLLVPFSWNIMGRGLTRSGGKDTLRS